ncbi:hypothetical protein HOA92_04795 [archaeon]|nr:hypothetical protein [archaeon]
MNKQKEDLAIVLFFLVLIIVPQIVLGITEPTEINYSYESLLSIPTLENSESQSENQTEQILSDLVIKNFSLEYFGIDTTEEDPNNLSENNQIEDPVYIPQLNESSNESESTNNNGTEDSLVQNNTESNNASDSGNIGNTSKEGGIISTDPIVNINESVEENNQSNITFPEFEYPIPTTNTTNDSVEDDLVLEEEIIEEEIIEELINESTNESVLIINKSLPLLSILDVSEYAIDLIYPTENVNVSQHGFFNFTVNVTCTLGTCGDTNVTLDPEAAVYNFSVCSATGVSGPSEANCNTSYSGTDLEGLVTVAGGIQNWTVPSTGTYTITAQGASGVQGGSGSGAGAHGSLMVGEFALTEGDEINILVGQLGLRDGTYGGGGGGGTFVIDATNDDILMIAGGGGGASIRSATYTAGRDATTTITGTNGSRDSVLEANAPGIDGAGGATSTNGGGAGAGYSGDGADYQSNSGGHSYLNGAAGGDSSSGDSDGGFGGAGAGYGGGGGGGGYNGAGAGGYDGNGGGGGGGGSVNNGSSQNNTVGILEQDGYVLIELTTSAKGGTVSTTAGDTPFYTNTSNPYNLTLTNGESSVITWWVNATGDLNSEHEFFAYVNQTNNTDTSNKTATFNITIIDDTLPVVDLLYPENTTYTNDVTELNYSFSDLNAGSCWYSTDNGVTNSSSESAGTNFSSVTSAEGGNTWYIYCNDSSGNEASDTVTFTKNLPSLSLDMVTSTTDANATQNETFAVSATVTCNNADCGEVNVSLDPIEESSVSCGADCNLCNQPGSPVTDSCDVLSVADCGGNGADGHFFTNDFHINGTFSPGGQVSIVSELDSNYGGAYFVTGWQDDVMVNEFGCYDGTDSYTDCDSGTYTSLDFADNKCNMTFGAGYTGSEVATFLADSTINISASLDSEYHFRVTYSYNVDCSTTGVGNGNGETDGDYCEESTYGENEGINITLSPTSKSGLVSTVIGDTPFYTNSSNPQNVSLDEGESTTITWTVNATGNIDSVHEFFVYANMTSDQSIQNESAHWNITIVNETADAPPTLTIDVPGDNTFTSNTIQGVNYTATDTDLDSCWYSNDSMSVNTTLAVCANIDAITWSEGEHNVTIWANDTTANLVNATVTFTVDTIYPSILISSPANESSTTNSTIHVNFTASDLNLASCFFTNDSMLTNTTLASCANITTINWSTGEHNVTIWTNDSAGNENSSDLTFTITTDDVAAPTITIQTPINTTYTSNTNVHVNYSAADETALDSCWYSNDSMLTNTTLSSCSNITSVTWSEGEHNVSIWANDTSGNENTIDVTFTVDTIYPSILISSPANESSTTNTTTHVNFTASDLNLASCFFTNDSMLTNTTLAGCANITSITWSGGEHNITIWTNDSAGNENRSDLTFTITFSYPLVDFGSLIPVNGSTTNNDYVELNFSVTEENLDEVKYNWNGTNYSVYNDSLVLMYNFDNLSSLGDNSGVVVDVSSRGNNGSFSGVVYNSSGRW